MKDIEDMLERVQLNGIVAYRPDLDDGSAMSTKEAKKAIYEVMLDYYNTKHIDFARRRELDLDNYSMAGACLIEIKEELWKLIKEAK